METTWGLAALVALDNLVDSRAVGNAGLKAVDIWTDWPAKVRRRRYQTCLDADQLDAMAACLRQEVTLIQGPPGTGKSTELCA